MSSLGTHQTHCCKQHGCKYSYTGDPCPVTSGEVEQSYPCESCRSTASINAQIAALQEELAWSQKLEDKGLTPIDLYDTWG